MASLALASRSLLNNSAFAIKKSLGLQNHYSMVCSMSRKGNCWDNVVMERFFLNLKMERVWRRGYANHLEAEKDITEYIVGFYNCERLHSARGTNRQLFMSKKWQQKNRSWCLKILDQYTSAFYSILSVLGNLIDDLSKTIPAITEPDQKHEYSIKFIKSNKDYYDLKVNKLKTDTNIVVHSYIIPFNKKLYGYKMPEGSVKWTYIYF